MFWMHKLNILWSKFKIKVVSSIVNIFATQTNYDIDNTVLLIGSTRSGTTFLMESLNSKNTFRIIFEPFNPTYTREWTSFGSRHYIDPANVNVQEAKSVHTILQGKITNRWVDQYNRKFRSDQRLIKSVRANLLVDYLEFKYPALKIIYIWRDPHSVVASRINLNFDPKDVFTILDHKLFVTKYYSEIDLENLQSYLHLPECCHAALWCFENRFLLKSKDQRNIKVIQYEYIIDKSISLSQNVVKIKDKKRKPSVTSSTQKTYRLGKEEVFNINVILSLFGMEEFKK
jgi:hypothetical protein